VWVCEPGEAAAPPENLQLAPGGQVATAVLAAARLGCSAAYVGVVGDDPGADIALAPLLAAGVDCRGVKRVSPGRTRAALIRVDRESGEREVHPERDPRVRLTRGDLTRRQIEGARALLLDVEDLDVSLWAADVAREAEVAVVLDAGVPDAAALPLLERVDFPIVSHEFAQGLWGDDTRAALRRLASRAGRLAVLTLGTGGAMALAPGRDPILESPAFPVEALDTTGAGDVFHAAFAWALLQGWGGRRVLRAANAAAAMSCRALGAQGGLPDRQALEAFLEADATEAGHSGGR